MPAAASDMNPAHRELVVAFSNSGYVVLYGRHGDDIIVLSIHHMREAGY